MGIYDRDYYQEKPPGFTFGGSRLMVTNLVIVNVVLFVANMLLFSSGNQLTDFMALRPGMFYDNWKVWELITYGFAHDPQNIWHILGNMFCLWFFGRDVEAIYGKKQFLLFYLSTIVLSGLIGYYADLIIWGRHISLIGASGGVAGVIMAYVFHYPRRVLLLYGIVPIPAWAFGVMFIVFDFAGSFDKDSHVAHSAHLAGAACGWIFYKTGWNLFRSLPSFPALQRLGRNPSVRLHQPDQDAEPDLNVEVDRILEKIGREGEQSLTRKERKTLERASRRYQQRDR